MALVVAVVATNRLAEPFVEACSDPADAVVVDNSFSLSHFVEYYCCCCCCCPLAGSELWRGADIVEVEHKTEGPLHLMEVLFSGPSSVKAEHRNHCASAVPMIVGTVVADNAAVVVGQHNDEIVGRLGC